MKMLRCFILGLFFHFAATKPTEPTEIEENNDIRNMMIINPQNNSGIKEKYQSDRKFAFVKTFLKIFLVYLFGAWAKAGSALNSVQKCSLKIEDELMKRCQSTFNSLARQFSLYKKMFAIPENKILNPAENEERIRLFGQFCRYVN